MPAYILLAYLLDSIGETHWPCDTTQVMFCLKCDLGSSVIVEEH
jgi:hypothetical protein